MVDVTPRSLNTATEVAALPVVNTTTGEAIAYAYIGRDGSVTGLDNNPEALRYFLQSLSAGEGRQLGDIINMLPNDTSREAFMGQVQRLAENLSLEPEYARSITVGDRQYNVSVNDEGKLQGVTPEELRANAELLRALLRETTEEQRTALRDAIVAADPSLAGEFDVAAGQVSDKTRAPAKAPESQALPNTSNPVLSEAFVPAQSSSYGSGVTVGGQSDTFMPTISTGGAAERDKWG